MASGALPGFRDFYPAEFAERAHLFAVWRDVAHRFGFVEYDGPPLEALELYTKKSGDEIVGQLYAFKDKGDREVALRPEMTPSLARMVAARANALRKPVRWFSIPQLFRYERQQRGRLREHFQLNMDIIGEPDVTADAELLASAVEIMKALGLKSDDVVARVSDRRLLNALLDAHGFSAAQLPAAYAALDKSDRDPRPVIEERLEKAGLDLSRRTRLFRIADSGQGAAGDLAGLEQEVRDARVEEAYTPLRRYLELLDALGVREWLKVDLRVVRGLDYYTGIVFELFDRKREFRAICGGGRYDTLLKSLGGVDLPALGFGMGDVVLGDLVRQRGHAPSWEPELDFWVAEQDDRDEGSMERVMRLATRLREQGCRVEFALHEQRFLKQLKSAAAAGARSVVMLPPALHPEDLPELKDMETGRIVPIPNLEEWIRSVTKKTTHG